MRFRCIAHAIAKLNAANPVADEKPETSLLLEEYKIVQTKIDKLGEDMFKVRSWCITLFTGVVAGAKLIGELSPMVVVLLAPVVLAFQIVEQRQRQVSRRSAKRGLQIELAMRRALRKSGKGTVFAPRLATQLLRQGSKDKSARRLRAWFQRRRQTPAAERRRKHETSGTDSVEASGEGSGGTKSPTFWECVVTQADFLFYVAQYGIILVLFVVCWKGSTPKALDSTLNIQLGTNTFAIAPSRLQVEAH